LAAPLAGRGARRISPLQRTWSVNVKEGSSSFLKKRTKKLLVFRGSTHACRKNDTSEANFKSFLLLFFKKEDLFFACLPSPQRAHHAEK
jgi:hypothetical protein